LRSRWKNAGRNIHFDTPTSVQPKKPCTHSIRTTTISEVARQQVSGSLRLYHSITGRQSLQHESMRRSCHSEKRLKTAITLSQNRSIHTACFCEGYNLCRANVWHSTKRHALAHGTKLHFVNGVRREIQKGCDSGVANAWSPLLRSSRKGQAVLLWY
jgi:hypothetical protein